MKDNMSSIVIDGHFDMLGYVLKKRKAGYKKVIEREFLPEFIEGGVIVVVASLFVESQYVPEMSMRNALDQIGSLYEEIEESNKEIRLCKSCEDIEEAIRSKKLAIILSFEGVEPIGNDLTMLRVFYELGVRIVGLTWSRRNYAADGCHFYNIEEGTKGGLTDFGVKLVKEAERLGMLIDVSHLNDEGFWDLIKICKKPIIASHSNAREVVKHPRNLTDEQINAIAKTGGVIGLNAYSDFVSNLQEEKSEIGLAKQAVYIKNLVGVKHIGLGFDFCDKFTTSNNSFLGGAATSGFDVIKGHGRINSLKKALIKNGFTEDEIASVFGNNFMRIYKNDL